MHWNGGEKQEGTAGRRNQCFRAVSQIYGGSGRSIYRVDPQEYSHDTGTDIAKRENVPLLKKKILESSVIKKEIILNKKEGLFSFFVVLLYQ